MYTQPWIKYLPVLRILLKRAVTEAQAFQLNVPDFDKGGPTRKTSYKFAIQFIRGKAANVANLPPIARDLAGVLMQEPAVKEQFGSKEYHISMDSKFMLSIRVTPEPVEETVVPVEEPVAEHITAD